LRTQLQTRPPPLECCVRGSSAALPQAVCRLALCSQVACWRDPGGVQGAVIPAAGRNLLAGTKCLVCHSHLLAVLAHLGLQDACGECSRASLLIQHDCSRSNCPELPAASCARVCAFCASCLSASAAAAAGASQRPIMPLRNQCILLAQHMLHTQAGSRLPEQPKH
jgi:hypothetical protein